MLTPPLRKRKNFPFNPIHWRGGFLPTKQKNKGVIDFIDHSVLETKPNSHLLCCIDCAEYGV
jgi:hypothetical protein